MVSVLRAQHLHRNVSIHNPFPNMQSKDTQLLTPETGDTLTGSYTPTSRTAKYKSRSSIQFDVLYVPHANTVSSPGDTKYVDMYIEYTNIDDTQSLGLFDVPSVGNWHPYKEEVDDGAGEAGSAGSSGTSTFFVRKFRINSTDSTASTNVDLSAIFTRPIFVNRVRLRIAEHGVGTDFGKLIVRTSAQSI